MLQWRSGVNVLKRNSVRLAEVWLDDYAKYYYQRIGNEKGDFGDITSRTALRFVCVQLYSYREKCRKCGYKVQTTQSTKYIHI